MQPSVIWIIAGGAAAFAVMRARDRRRASTSSSPGPVGGPGDVQTPPSSPSNLCDPSSPYTIEIGQGYNAHDHALRTSSPCVYRGGAPKCSLTFSPQDLEAGTSSVWQTSNLGFTESLPVEGNFDFARDGKVWHDHRLRITPMQLQQLLSEGEVMLETEPSTWRWFDPVGNWGDVGEGDGHTHPVRVRCVRTGGWPE